MTHGPAAVVLAGLLLGAAVLAGAPARRRWVPTSRVAAPPDPVTVTLPVLLDLVRAALAAGLPTLPALEAVLAAAPGAVDQTTRRAVLHAASAAHDPLRRAAPTEVGPDLQPLVRALTLADRTGASVAVLLQRAAADARADRSRRTSVAAGRLGVRLVLPLGLATLPSFVLLGVAPVVIGLAGEVLSAR